MEEKFCELFTETLMIESAEVRLEDTFRDYDEWDSLSQLSLIALLDEEYSVEIESDDFDKLLTVKDLFNEVQTRATV